MGKAIGKVKAKEAARNALEGQLQEKARLEQHHKVIRKGGRQHAAPERCLTP